LAGNNIGVYYLKKHVLSGIVLFKSALLERSLIPGQLYQKDR
jgi:hypothetical protein